MFNLFRHEVRIRRGSIIGWSIGLALYAVMYTSFYPAMPREMLELDFQDIEIYRAFGDMNMSTFEGYMTSSVFNFLPILLGIFVIIAGTATLAGEEDNGTLELLVTLPLPRWQVVLAKALALALVTLIIVSLIGLAVVAVFAAIQSQIDTTATAFDLFVMTLSTWPISMVFLMLSLFLGAYLPTRRAAGALAAVVLGTSYFGNNLASMFESLQPIQPLSPFYYFDTSATALVEGVAGRDVLVLLATSGVFVLLAILSFRRRNITVSAWPWQRPRGVVGT